MRKTILLAGLLIALFSLPVLAQSGEKQQVPIDQLLEADAKHNLDVAWQYFRRKKAYQAVLMRLDETIVAHPTFSKMDEVLYLAGMSSYYLWSGKGKQKINFDLLSDEEKERFAPERLRGDAEGFLGHLIEEFPDSKYREKASETLKTLKTEN